MTRHQKKIMARDAGVYARWKELTSDPRNARMEIYRIIGEEFDITSPSTIWAIVQRIENGYTRKKGGKKGKDNCEQPA